jgi:hypothetical protein
LLTGGFPRWPGDKPVPLLAAPPSPLRPVADGRVCSSAPRQGVARGPCPQEPHGRVRSCGLRRKRAGTGGICLGYRRGKTVRACFTSALLLRREIVGLHTSTGTLIGHLPRVPPSAWCDCAPTPRLLSISKRDTHGRRSSEVIEMLDQLFIIGLRGCIRQLCRNTQLGGSSAVAIGRDLWDGLRVAQAVHGCTR